MKNILVVDSDPNTRSAMSIALRQTGYKVSAALDEAEALSLLLSSHARRRHFDLLIVDTGISETEDKRLIDAARQKGRPIPILPVSNYSDKAFFIDLLQNGHKEFIEKTCARKGPRTHRKA